MKPVKKIAAAPVAADGYGALLAELKERIGSAQLSAKLAVNRELLSLYWEIGRRILERQAREGWGSKVVDRLAADLHRAFPEVRGFSARNLKYMRAFAEIFRQPSIVQQLLHNLPWFHVCTLIDKVKDRAEWRWYAREAATHGWSRSALVHHVEARLFHRQGKAVTNFARTLPPPQSDLASALLKDPYQFDFLSLGPDAQERDLERALLDHVRDFLLELGVGFSFVGSQVPLQVGGEDFYLDLLFFHLRLRCFVVVDLKMVAFRPEFAGKMNFYLAAVDELLRHQGDQPTVGLILCKEKNKVIVEYALRDSGKPIGVSAYSVTARLPRRLEGSLPTVAALEAELAAAVEAEGAQLKALPPSTPRRSPPRGSARGSRGAPGRARSGRSRPC